MDKFALSGTLLENESVILNSNKRTLFFKRERVLIEMTELQRRFMLCLLSGISEKNEIIRSVWCFNHESISDNNYHQMIFQCRSLLERHGIPGGVIKTIPRFGIMLCLQTSEQEFSLKVRAERKTAWWIKSIKEKMAGVKYKAVLAITLVLSVVMFVGFTA